MSHRLSRRQFLATLSAATVVSIAGADVGKPRRILLRSSWQTINIGDIAHTPGMLALLETHLPEAEVTLWPSSIDNGVEAMLRARFPKLRIAETTHEKQGALEACDICLHGSGPGFVAAADIAKWRKTGKPYVIGGITLNDAELKDRRDLLADAKFIFCRDTDSLHALEASKTSCPHREFGPDATFFLDLRDDEKADAFLREHALKPGKFACFVPRLRYTPYWKIRKSVPPEEVAKREAVNEKHAEPDHAKLREAITGWVRGTGNKALLCPEMTYQVELLRPLLFDRLPEDVKPHVVVRPGYWLTDEAASTYARAAAIVSCEMHSPIIAIANGTPAIHVRQPTDTRKGQMWRDVGLGDWLFEVETATGEAISQRLLTLVREPEETRDKIAKARAFIAKRGRAMTDAVAVG
ncbi:polysaccharide pyruvyl transferase family protein [Singulisphaera acidiphila]|uniref:Polysaccharide pyruvyl transferase n=1 Tax=Singulisphaera acidiphila (strain ATCC BAA-1392 / DSM 18658 / VKM B-2454 / MOB10) TaxID=886293 RepID=L0DIL4_SINAD|nr:polysaccharide pyruvyl transferase family protein [Singulisphaera acidiphila]AGA28658.1 Polysaccharide pyruvyl transferase [Singulisphaera acidiphila DSM 18658]